jgi:hypothetical protein
VFCLFTPRQTRQLPSLHFLLSIKKRVPGRSWLQHLTFLLYLQLINLSQQAEQMCLIYHVTYTCKCLIPEYTCSRTGGSRQRCKVREVHHQDSTSLYKLCQVKYGGKQYIRHILEDTDRVDEKASGYVRCGETEWSLELPPVQIHEKR